MTISILRKVFISVILLATIVACTTEAQIQWRKFSYFDNKKGLDDNLSTTEIDDAEATDLQNVVFDIGGAIKKRFGFTNVPIPPIYTVATGSVNCVNGLCFYKKDDGSRYLFAISNSDGTAVAHKKNFSATGGPVAGLWNYLIGPTYTLSATYSNDYQPDFAIASDSIVFTTGKQGNPWVWDGTGCIKKLITSGMANQATGTVVEYHKNQLFVTGDTDYPSRVYFSDLGDITSYYRTDFFDVQTTDGSKVRSLCSAFDSLYIFKDKSIWRLSGDERDSFRLQLMVSGIGTISNGSVKVVNNYIYFTTAQNDIAVYDGAYTCKFISQKIRGTIGDLNFQRATNNISAAFSTYKYNDFDYYVSTTLSGSTTNNRILVFDTQHSAWTKFKGINANAMCVGDNDTFQNALYFGDYSGYVYRYPSTKYIDGSVATEGTVASVAIASFYQTKWFKYSDICLGDKYWRLLKTYVLSEDDTTLYAECKADYESSGRVVTIDLNSNQAKWDAGTWDISLWGGECIIVGRNEIEKGKNMFQIKYYQNDAGKGFTILGYENFVEPTLNI